MLKSDLSLAHHRVPCFICHQPADKSNSLPLCDNCMKKYGSQFDPECPFKNSFSQIVPSSSVEKLSAELQYFNKQNKGHKYSFKTTKQRQIQKYYHSVNEWINVMDQLNHLPDSDDLLEDKNEVSFSIRCATYCSFGLNLMLLIGKALAMSSSSSYTIMSSLADSCLDLVAGIIISCTAVYSKTTEEDKIKYPVGKSRISTVGILVFSILMSCCAIFIIMQCLHSLLEHEIAPPTTSVAIHIMFLTIFVKLCMWIVYTWLNHPITLTLAEDHRNDVFTNSFGLFMYWGGEHFHWWMDSAGGLLLSLFVLNSWSKNALENAKMLIGIQAEPNLIRNLTYVAAHHHPLIKSVSGIIAFQIGPSYFCEVSIVIDNKTSSEVTCYIADTLKKRLEKIEDIEHAYVHVETINHDKNLEKVLDNYSNLPKYSFEPFT